MKFSRRYAHALVGAMGLMVAAESAQALDLNGKGSSAGRNFAGQGARITSVECAGNGGGTNPFHDTSWPINCCLLNLTFKIVNSIKQCQIIML